MKYIQKHSLQALSLTAVSLAPAVASAQSGDGQLTLMLTNIVIFINNTLIPFIIALGFLFFVWGMFKYFVLGGADDDKRQQGRSLMIYATFGFVAIILFFGVINMITSSTGLEGETLKYIPTVEIPGA